MSANNAPSIISKNKQKKLAKKVASSNQPSDENHGTEVEQEDVEKEEVLQDATKKTDAHTLKELEYEILKIANKKHDFWDTQPVPKLKDTISVSECGPIDDPKTPSDVRQDPFPLLSSFEWTETDIDDDKTINEIYTLLNENYVEDDDNMFRFDYSIPFLRWVLKPPGYHKSWHIGVRVKTSGKLVAFITGIPATIRLYEKEMRVPEINFLCVHKKLRSKRLAPILIKEITRRVHLTNIWQAVYTAGIVLPRPVASCRYYHRSLNPKKLIAVGFSHLGQRMTLARAIKLYKLAETPKTPGLRPMERKDVAQVTVLLQKYLAKYKLAAIFNEEEVSHWFGPRDGVIHSYVVEDPARPNVVTDFLSFYILPSTVIGNKEYPTLRAAYSFYNIANTVDFLQLMNDALIVAKKVGVDVFNALDIMENEPVFKELKFGIGDGKLQYYIYNWKCPAMPAPDVGLVLM